MIHFLLNWYLLTFSIYIIFECLDALSNMPHGIQFLCHKLRYVFIGCVSIMHLLAGYLGSATVYACIVTGIFFLMVLPRMEFRYHRWTQHPWGLK